MDKLKMHSINKVDANIAAIGKLFPNCVTERMGENGEVETAIDFDMLKQELSSVIVEGNEERYQFTWPDKKKAILAANAPISATLRPCREESVDFDTTQNLYIEGDNLDVLKLLQETYLGKVKMIYIDPPYNTGNDFIYDDDFAEDTDKYLANSGQYDDEGNRLVQNTDNNGRFHTNWLNMLYPRLKLARDLLSEDGILFVSIDDNENSNLQKICDEIFGKTNFVGALSVENNPKGRKNSAFISVSSEHCIIYAKNKQSAYFIDSIPKKASDMVLDENGVYVHNSGKRVLVGENSFNNYVQKDSSDKNYSVYFKKSTYEIVVKKEKLGENDSQLMQNGFIKYYSHSKGKLVENTYSETKFKELFEKRALDFSKDKIYEKNFADTIRIKSQLVNREYEAIVHGVKQKYSMELTTTGAGTYLKTLFDLSDTPFTAPKNVGFLKTLISLIDGDDFTVLDFFAGSSTTADAVLQLNSIDGKNRKYIMVQIPEIIEAKEPAYKAGYKNICEIGKERIRRAGKKIKEESPLTTQNLDIGFRVLKLDSSNMKDVYYNPADMTQDIFAMVSDNIKEDRTPEDLLFQVMLDRGIPLSSKIEESVIAGKKVFNVEDNFLIACFDQNLTEDVIKAIAQMKPYYFVMRDSSMANDSVATNFDQIFATYSPDTDRRVL